MTPPVLEFAGVSKDYRALRPLRVDRLSVSAAERLAIVGFDLAAAEVFVNLATGAVLPDAGEVLAFGRPTSAIAESAEWLSLVDRFGIVSDRAVLLDGLTVLQNLAMPFTLEIEPPPDDIVQRASSLAREVGLRADDWGKRAADLDADARMRIRLARALALDPAILLLEHPTATVERSQAGGLGRDVLAIAERRGVALVAITADEAFARAVAPRVVTVDGRGRLGRHYFF